MMSAGAANLKMNLIISVAPSPLNTLLENAPVLSEALLNKLVGCACSSALAFLFNLIIRKHAFSHRIFARASSSEG